MRPKVYPNEKKKIIAQKPVNDLIKFIAEIPWEDQAKLLSVLPVVQGFRKGHRLELEKRRLKFIQRLKMNADKDERDWELFRSFWMRWVKSHDTFYSILDSFDNSKDFLDNKEVPPNSSLDIKCFEYLLTASEEGKISREEIEKFYEYGYFLPDINIEIIISRAKPESELKSEQRLLILSDKITQIEVIINNLQEQQNVEIQAIDKLKQTINSELEKFGGSFQQDDNKLAQLEEILEKLNRLEISIEERFQNSKIEIETKLASFEELAVTHTQPIQFNSVLPVQHISSTSSVAKYTSINEVLTQLSKNFSNIGLVSGSANALSREVLSGLGAGQLVMFQGSMASILASVCAKSLSALNQDIISIPIGILTPNEFRLTFQSIIDQDKTKKSIRLILLEGLNRSAIEVYGDCLKSFISERIFGLQTSFNHILLLGTIVEGISSFPISSGLCELGPILHSDFLTWTNGYNSVDLMPGEIQSDVWKEWTVINYTAQNDLLDLNELQEKFREPSILWKSSLNLAIQKLSALCQKNVVPTAIQSFTFGWLLPRVVLTSNKENLLFDEEIFSPEDSDPRIKKWLKFIRNKSEV